MNNFFERFGHQIREEQIAYPEQFHILADRWRFEINERYAQHLTAEERKKLLEMLNSSPVEL